MAEEIIKLVAMVIGFALDRLGDEGHEIIRGVLDDEARKRAEGKYLADRKAKFGE